MLFFDLLPADVQIVILQIWVGTELSSLSALDVAFCSRSRRPEFLTWMTQACHRWELTVSWTIASLSQCVMWLAARNLVPFGLELECCQPPTASSAESADNPKLLFKGNMKPQEVQSILSQCAHIASVRYSHQVSSFNDLSSNETFFVALASVPLVNLHTLSICTNIPLSMEQVVLSAFQAICPKLIELDLRLYTDDINSLFDVIIEHCKVLRHFAHDEPIIVVQFDVLTANIQAESILRLVVGIPSLTSLRLGFSIRIHVHNLFPVLQQLRSLHMCYEGSFGEFVGLLEQFPQLETLNWPVHNFCRNDGSLQLWCKSKTALDTSDWSRCVAARPAIRTLSFSLTLVRGNEIAMACIGEAYGETLEIVNLHDFVVDDLTSVDMLLRHCSTLSTLIVVGMDELVCRPPFLRMMSSKCPQLTYLFLQGRVGDAVVEDGMPLITDADMEKLCINCPKLSMLVLHGHTNITSQTLDTFIRLKMRFKHIQFSSSKFSITEADVDEFKRQVKEHGLLPMPSEVWLLSPVDDIDIDDF